MASVDGSSFIAAAIRAAILAKAPRRTVQAIAAAVTSVLVHQIADACPKTKDADHVRSSNASNPRMLSFQVSLLKSMWRLCELPEALGEDASGPTNVLGHWMLKLLPLLQ